MQAIRSTNTKMENKVFTELWRRDIRFRRNVKNLIGKPDLAIKKYKVVVFLDSCFWHGCDLHCRIPENNRDYWINKLNRNKMRDIEVNNYYQKEGWNILRIWEHQVKKEFNTVIKEIVDFINEAKK